MSNEVEHYLAAYNEADAEAMKLKTVAESIERVAHALRAGSRSACADALPDYPTSSRICTLLSGLEQAKDRLQQLWEAVPAEMQQRLPPPSRAGKPATEVSFIEQ
jgi:hypothetical protein